MGALTLTTYAQLLARLACRRGARVEDVLAELGVGVEDLARDEPALRRELAAAWPSRKGIAAMKFASALANELARQGALAREIPASSPPEAPPAEPEKTLPSYLQAPGPAEIVPPAVDAPPVKSRGIPSGTADLDVGAIISRLTRGPLPFAVTMPQKPATAPSAEPTDASDGLDLDRFPLEEYASLSGALARGEPRADVLARHGLSAEAYDKLAKAWAQRFEREPHMFARFRELAQRSAKRRDP